MDINPHHVFYLFKSMFEERYGCFNISNLKNQNSVDSNIATELFNMFISLCDESSEIIIEDSLDMNREGSEFVDNEDGNENNINELDDSLSQEFNSQMYEIEKYIKNKFTEAREKRLPVHDIDLRRWAIEEARRIELNKFKGSPSFIKNLKFRLRICSRKVTKLVTKNYSNEKVETEERKAAHLQFTNSKIPQYNLDFIMNSNQSGFSKEYFSTRTLSFRGEKDTLQSVKSISNTTHSYTIQPIITASGKLLSPMLICLQETTGNEFGPRVSLEIIKNTPNNLIVVCSKSGKLTKEHVKKWLAGCLIPQIKEKTLVLLDRWSGQTEDFLMASLSPEKADSVEVITIPPGTTGLCQPLDVYFFRQSKIFVRAIYNQMMLESTEQETHDRNFFLKIHSLVHNQLTADVFRPMLQYAWYKSGYHVADPGKFRNVNEVCFNKEQILDDCAICENSVFIKCAHCNKSLCLKDFLEKICWH
ncbi:uncharacterized protein LOC112494251 [Cephus cinctus]|uniref:Uncharacterized protein LOC112494251 n=1 Tax=Cephus cinctus TaxID=211228 RepID=A0AAJ7RGH9_CEPCN|nr:uncharacterized protein LOC112494251 [Cephus cinctus]